MTTSPALALAYALFAATPAPATPPADAAGASFETLGQGAVKTRDIATLLSPFVERCDSETRDIDRARCQATTAYLRHTLPRRTFAFTTDEPGVVAVSEYDASVKGYHVALAGCVACSNPITIGKAKEPRLITLKVPDKDADSLMKAVSLSRNTFGFDSLADAKRWADAERPFLRAEFLFQPQIVGDVWTYGSNRGVALKLVGARVYNRCTGDVLVSKPPSTGSAERPSPGHEDATCKARPSRGERNGRRDAARERRSAGPADQGADRRLDGEDPAAGVRLLPAVQVAGNAGADLRRGRQRHRAVGRGRTDVRGNADGPLRADRREGRPLPAVQDGAAEVQLPVLPPPVIAVR